MAAIVKIDLLTNHEFKMFANLNGNIIFNIHYIGQDVILKGSGS